MTEQKKFYWLKLKKDFFKRHDIQIIEGMPNGKDYVLFYLKLMCESIDHNGNLRFSDTIPYDENMLSTITNTNIDIVRSALKLLQQLKMVEILDDSTIYMTEVNKFIGSAVDNDNANRQRRFRERQKELALAERYESVTKNNESKSIEQDKDIENTTTTTTNYMLYLQSDEYKLFDKVGKSFQQCGIPYKCGMVEDFIAYNESRGWLGIGGESVLDNLDRYVCRWYEGEKSRLGIKEEI